MKKDTIYFSRNEFDSFLEGDLIEVGSEKISLNLLKSLLSDNHYEELKCILKGDSSVVIISPEVELIPLFDRFKIQRHKISFLVRAFENILIDDSTNDRDFDRILSIRELCCFERFIERYKDKFFYLRIDNREYKIRGNKIINFLLLDEQYYKLFLNRKSYDDLPLDDFLYSIKCFFTDMSLCSKYIFPGRIKSKLKDIMSSKYVDIESKNNILETVDPWIKKSYIDSGFKNKILSSIPVNLTLLEKSIYLYIILCQTLTYDPLYMAYDEYSRYSAFHTDVKNIGKVNEENNRVVCYEFNELYGMFLKELDVNYESNASRYLYSTHASLKYRVDKYLVSADSVTSVLDGDLVRSKVGYPLNGLKCLNHNKETREEFDEAFDRVYEMLKKSKTKINIKDDSSLSIDDKLKLLIKIANLKDLELIDKLGYIYLLRDEVLNEQERIDYTYVIVNSSLDEINPLRCIFTFKSNNEYLYYFYEPGKKLEEISKDKLKSMFDEGTLKYMTLSYLRVPFLEEKESSLFNSMLIKKPNI